MPTFSIRSRRAHESLVASAKTIATVAALVLALPHIAFAQASGDAARYAPRLDHVGLNTVDPERAIAWYLKLWPSAKRTTIAGFPAVQGDMALLFNKVDRPPAGAWRDDLHRAEAQSAFWHIGANTDATTTRDRLGPLGIVHLPLFVYPNDTTHTVWRSGLAPYAGTPTAAQIASIQNAPPRDGGFSYVVAPDGVLFELTGGPTTRDSFSHIHFFHEQPLCAANWFVDAPRHGAAAGARLERQGDAARAVVAVRCEVRRGRLAGARTGRHDSPTSGHGALRERIDVVVSASVCR